MAYTPPLADSLPKHWRAKACTCEGRMHVAAQGAGQSTPGGRDIHPTSQRTGCVDGARAAAKSTEHARLRGGGGLPPPCTLAELGSPAPEPSRRFRDRRTRLAQKPAAPRSAVARAKPRPALAKGPAPNGRRVARAALGRSTPQFPSGVHARTRPSACGGGAAVSAQLASSGGRRPGSAADARAGTRGAGSGVIGGLADRTTISEASQSRWARSSPPGGR